MERSLKNSLEKWNFSEDFINENFDYIFNNMFSREFDVKKSFPNAKANMDAVLFENAHNFPSDANVIHRLYNCIDMIVKATGDFDKSKSFLMNYFTEKTAADYQKLISQGIMNVKLMNTLIDKSKLSKWLNEKIKCSL